MKNLHIATLLLGLTACSIDKTPYDGLSQESLMHDLNGLQAATSGNYAFLKDADFTRHYHMLNEYPGDNVTLSGTTGDALFLTYTYRHTADQANTLAFYRKAYQVIVGANKVLENLKEGQGPATDQLIGENLFLRAFAHFSLVNVFGRPYSQSPETNLGVVLKTDTRPDDNASRATVKEVYAAVEADLLRAASLMTLARPNAYASAPVAQALLARLYLYMNQHDKALEYAGKVIGSGRYTLMPTGSLPTFYSMDISQNTEIIFALKHTLRDDRAWASLGSMYATSPGGVGWGEMYASQEYQDLLARSPADRRSIYLARRLTAQGTPEKRNGIDKVFILKYSNQDGIATLSSPVVLRLAEMYLIRAEANAKLGNTAQALADVNLIRQRAGLSGSDLYTAADLRGLATPLDVVLQERRLELAFEGHRALDLFRNGRCVVRNYPGFHNIQTGQQTICADDKLVVHLIPEAEIIMNPNLKQNPI